MEELLKEYLQDYYNYLEIDIRHFEINGSICSVKCRLNWDEEHHNINIWDMLVFLNNK